MAIDLPPEIWMAVASFLPKGVIKRLYSVNKVFLDITMNEIYSKITIDLAQMHRDQRKAMSMLQLESESSLPARVRELAINLVDLPMDESTSTGTPALSVRSHVAGLFNGEKEPLSTGSINVDWLDSVLYRIIPRMKNLKHLKLSTARLAVKPPVLKCLDPIWRLCSDTVTHLHIHFSISQFPTIFNELYKSLLQGNRIHTLIVEETPPSTDSDVDSIAGQLVVAELVESCQSSLCKLVIVGPNSEIERLPLLSRLEGLVLPVLTDLSLQKFASTSTADKLLRTSLIQRHARSLEHLCILGRDGEGKTFDFGTLDDLNLQAFTVSATYILYSYEEALSFLSGQTNLKKLSIDSIAPIPAFMATVKLLRAFQAQNPSRILEELNLDLGVDTDLRLLAFLAAVVKVDKLTVKFMYFKLEVNQGYDHMLCKPSCGFPYVETSGVMPDLSISFFRRLARYEKAFCRWNLRELVLQTDVCCGTRTLWGMMFACSQQIPSLGKVADTDITDKPVLPVNDFVQCSDDCLLKGINLL